MAGLLVFPAPGEQAQRQQAAGDLAGFFIKLLDLLKRFMP